MEIKNEQELIALSRLFNFLKFECDDVDSLLFAASPVINSLYRAILDDLGDIYSRKGRKGTNDEWGIESYPIYLEGIRNNIAKTENWNSLSPSIKKQYIHELIAPYKYRVETLAGLIDWGDNLHSA